MTDPKKAAERETMDENLKTWPERIWLQHGEDEVPDFNEVYVRTEDMTWCHDKIEHNDIEYVRADLAALPSVQVQNKHIGSSFDEYLDSLGEETRQAIEAKVASATAVQVPQWISVSERLPETFVTDDSECWLQGKRLNPAINSVRVMVALSGQGVRVDRLAGLEGHAPFWETYRDRVTHWQPLPPPPAAPQGDSK